MYSGEGVYKTLLNATLKESGAEVNASALCDANPAVTKPMFLKENHHVSAGYVFLNAIVSL